MARRAREEAPGEDREVPGRWRRAGEFCVVEKVCADFLLNSQLTPAVPPVLRSGRRDGPGVHVAQGQEEVPGEDREVPGCWRRAGEFCVIENFVQIFYLTCNSLPPSLLSFEVND